MLRPLDRSVDVADDRLPALGDMDVLDRHLLPAATSVSFQRLELHREGAGQLVKRPLYGVLMGDILDVRQAAGEHHRGHVDKRMLSI